MMDIDCFWLLSFYFLIYLKMINNDCFIEIYKNENGKTTKHKGL